MTAPNYADLLAVLEAYIGLEATGSPGALQRRELAELVEHWVDAGRPYLPPDTHENILVDIAGQAPLELLRPDMLDDLAQLIRDTEGVCRQYHGQDPSPSWPLRLVAPLRVETEDGELLPGRLVRVGGDRTLTWLPLG